MLIDVAVRNIRSKWIRQIGLAKEVFEAKMKVITEALDLLKSECSHPRPKSVGPGKGFNCEACDAWVVGTLGV